MTNEEYRQYVHNMYKENFLDKGKKPKWIQIFGDSFGNWISEGTWPHELSQLLGCSVVGFAKAGANNIRTLSYFHQYYDPECLNIVLFTNPGRLYINDEMFSLNLEKNVSSTLTLLGNYPHAISEKISSDIKDAISSYYKFLQKENLDYIIESKLFMDIFDLKNTVLLNCFPFRELKMLYDAGQVSEKFLNFYYCRFPELLNGSLLSYQKLQYLDNDIKKKLSFENIKSRDSEVSLEGVNYRNHLSINTQKHLGEIIYNILLLQPPYVIMEKIQKPESYELISSDKWAEENSYKRKKIDELNIKLTPFHEKYL